MEIPDFIALLNKTADKEIEKYAWDMWVAWYPQLDNPKPSFGEFLANIKQTEPVSKEQPEERQNGLYADQVFF